MKDRHSQYDGDEVRYLTGDGKAVRADDEWFDSVVRDWGHQGVDTDVVYMARPLLDGTPKQKALAHRFLAQVRDQYTGSTEAQQQLLRLLVRERVGVGPVPHMTQSEFLKAWDDFSGPRSNGPGDVSFSHSDKTLREARWKGTDPDA
jgi:hypothetical protein